jgi:hypothetical protein
MIAMVEDGQARKRGAVVEGRKVWLLLLENDKEDKTMRGKQRSTQAEACWSRKARCTRRVPKKEG